MVKMILKANVNDLYFQYQLRVSQDACLVHIWWYQSKAQTSYHADKPHFLEFWVKKNRCSWSPCLHVIFSLSHNVGWCHGMEILPALLALYLGNHYNMLMIETFETFSEHHNTKNNCHQWSLIKIGPYCACHMWIQSPNTLDPIYTSPILHGVCRHVSMVSHLLCKPKGLYITYIYIYI